MESLVCWHVIYANCTFNILQIRIPSQIPLEGCVWQSSKGNRQHWAASRGSSVGQSVDAYIHSSSSNCIPNGGGNPLANENRALPSENGKKGGGNPANEKEWWQPSGNCRSLVANEQTTAVGNSLENNKVQWQPSDK